MKYLFIIYDEGDQYKITGCREESDDNFMIDPKLYYETKSEQFYNQVKKLLETDYILTYSKSIGDPTISQLTKIKLDSLEQKKAKTRTQGKNISQQRFDYMIAFDFFEFQILNNQLISKNIIITDENREEEYLKIINSGDSKLIDLLEKYLEILDRLTVHKHQYDNFITFKNRVNASTNNDEVEAAYTAFAKSMS